MDKGFGSTVKWDVDLLSGYPSTFLENLSSDPGTHHFMGLRNPGISRALQSWDPDAILLFGYKSYSHLKIILWARLHGIPLVFRGDSHFLGRLRLARWRRTLLRLLYGQFAAITYVGKSNKDYFVELGVHTERLFFAPHSVNSRLFDPLDPLHSKAAARAREQLGICASTRVILFAGKLVPSKQPLELLRAFLALGSADAALIFVGDGSERNRIEACAAEAPGARVFILPFSNQSEMPARYLMADLFILPSKGNYETWGLAVNEAMHMGIPCIVSNLVGCQMDLVVPNVTGWTFDSADPGALGDALGTALSELDKPERRLEILSAVRAKISEYTYTQTTNGLLSALAAVWY